MKASIFHSRGNIRCEDVPDLVISSPGQMIVAIEATSICGSDLYLYEGPFDALVPGGHVTGHEILGRVIDVGKDVARFRKGDCKCCFKIPQKCWRKNPQRRLW